MSGLSDAALALIKKTQGAIHERRMHLLTEAKQRYEADVKAINEHADEQLRNMDIFCEEHMKEFLDG